MSNIISIFYNHFIYNKYLLHLGTNINKESHQQQRHDVPATVEKQIRPPTGSSHNSTPPVSSPGMNQLTTSSNGGNASAARPPSAPTHHSTSTSSNSAVIPPVPSDRQSSLASLLGIQDKL